MLLSSCLSATEVVRGVRFPRMFIACIPLREVGKKTKHPSTKPGEPKQREAQAVTPDVFLLEPCHKLPLLHQAALHF